MPVPCFAPARSAASITAAMRSVMSRAFVTLSPPSSLEPDVLQRLCRGAVEVGCEPVIAAPRREVAPGDPGSCAMAGGSEPAEAFLGGCERRLRLVEAVLRQQRASEHELRTADLVEIVLPALEQLQRVTRLLFGLPDVTAAQMNLRERRNGAAGISLVADVERNPEGLLQQRDRFVGLAEQEVEATEVVRQLTDVHPVGERLVRAARPLGVRAREDPVPLAVCDERSLEERVADRARIACVLGELKRALDVLARGLVVAHPAPATRAPGEDVRAKRVGRHARALGKTESLVQQPERRLHAVQLVAADAERVEDLRALEIGEVPGLDDAPRGVQQLERGAERA